MDESPLRLVYHRRPLLRRRGENRIGFGDTEGDENVHDILRMDQRSRHTLGLFKGCLAQRVFTCRLW